MVARHVRPARSVRVFRLTRDIDADELSADLEAETAKEDFDVVLADMCALVARSSPAADETTVAGEGRPAPPRSVGHALSATFRHHHSRRVAAGVPRAHAPTTATGRSAPRRCPIDSSVRETGSAPAGGPGRSSTRSHPLPRPRLAPTRLNRSSEPDDGPRCDGSVPRHDLTRWPGDWWSTVPTDETPCTAPRGRAASPAAWGFPA